MKTKVDEIKEIGQSIGMYVVGYGNQIFLNYQEMGLDWLGLALTKNQDYLLLQDISVILKPKTLK